MIIVCRYCGEQIIWRLKMWVTVSRHYMTCVSDFERHAPLTQDEVIETLIRVVHQTPPTRSGSDPLPPGD